MKSLAKFFLTNKALSWLMLILMLGGGIFAYNNMGKLEDAPLPSNRPSSPLLIRVLHPWKYSNK